MSLNFSEFFKEANPNNLLMENKLQKTPTTSSSSNQFKPILLLSSEQEVNDLKEFHHDDNNETMQLWGTSKLTASNYSPPAQAFSNSIQSSPVQFNPSLMGSPNNNANISKMNFKISSSSSKLMPSSEEGEEESNQTPWRYPGENSMSMFEDHLALENSQQLMFDLTNNMMKHNNNNSGSSLMSKLKSSSNNSDQSLPNFSNSTSMFINGKHQLTGELIAIPNLGEDSLMFLNTSHINKKLKAHIGSSSFPTDIAENDDDDEYTIEDGSLSGNSGGHQADDLFRLDEEIQALKKKPKKKSKAPTPPVGALEVKKTKRKYKKRTPKNDQQDPNEIRSSPPNITINTNINLTNPKPTPPKSTKPKRVYLTWEKQDLEIALDFIKKSRKQGTSTQTKKKKMRGVPFDVDKLASKLQDKNKPQLRDFYYRSIKNLKEALNTHISMFFDYKIESILDHSEAFIAFLRATIRKEENRFKLNQEQQKGDKDAKKGDRRGEHKMYQAFDYSDMLGPVWRTRYGRKKASGYKIVLRNQSGELSLDLWIFPSQTLQFALDRFTHYYPPPANFVYVFSNMNVDLTKNLSDIVEDQSTALVLAVSLVSLACKE